MKRPRRVWVLVSGSKNKLDFNGGLAVFSTKADAEAYRKKENEWLNGDYMPPVAYTLVKP